MNAPLAAVRRWLEQAAEGWNRFWFRPARVETLCAIRVLCGWMLFYTHLVWSLGLEDFFGPQAWLSAEALAQSPESHPLAWSWFWWIDSPGLLWAVHIAALVVFFLFFLGLWSRVTSVLAFLATVAYIHRVPAATFGLDQINTILSMYLMLGPCGACYSLDAWLARRRAARQGKPSSAQEVPPRESVGANVALRLIQLHMCVMYFFAGIGKLQGATWWDGSAMWWAAASYEYQSLDLTWMANWPVLVALLTHLTVWWEVTYPALVWFRWWRPLVLGMAVAVHLGIAASLGMITFGTAMLFGNLAFVSGGTVAAVVGRLAGLLRRKK